MAQLQVSSADGLEGPREPDGEANSSTMKSDYQKSVKKILSILKLSCKHLKAEQRKDQAISISTQATDLECGVELWWVAEKDRLQGCPLERDFRMEEIRLEIRTFLAATVKACSPHEGVEPIPEGVFGQWKAMTAKVKEIRSTIMLHYNDAFER